MKNNDFENFSKFYTDLYKKILDEYYIDIENMIKGNKISSILNYVVLGIGISILFVIFFFNILNIFILILFLLLYNFAIYKFVKSYHTDNKEKLLNKFKYNVLDDIITLITGNNDSKVFPSSRISSDSFNKNDLFNLEKLFYDGRNYIQTALDNNTVVLGDIDLYILQDKYKDDYVYYGDKKFLRTYLYFKKKYIFKGSYIGAYLNRKNDCYIQIVPSDASNIKNKLNKYFKLYDNQIFLENAIFSKNYNVYTNDEIKSRMTLTLTMMEKINSLEEIIDNKKYFIFKNDGRFSVFIEDFSIEDILNKNLNTSRENELENIYNLYNDILKLFMIINTINE